MNQNARINIEIDARNTGALDQLLQKVTQLGERMRALTATPVWTAAGAAHWGFSVDAQGQLHGLDTGQFARRLGQAIEQAPGFLRQIYQSGPAQLALQAARFLGVPTGIGMASAMVWGGYENIQQRADLERLARALGETTTAADKLQKKLIESADAYGVSAQAAVSFAKALMQSGMSLSDVQGQSRAIMALHASGIRPADVAAGEAAQRALYGGRVDEQLVDTVVALVMQNPHMAGRGEELYRAIDNLTETLLARTGATPGAYDRTFLSYANILGAFAATGIPGLQGQLGAQSLAAFGGSLSSGLGYAYTLAGLMQSGQRLDLATLYDIRQNPMRPEYLLAAVRGAFPQGIPAGMTDQQLADLSALITHGALGKDVAPTVLRTLSQIAQGGGEVQQAFSQLTGSLDITKVDPSQLGDLAALAMARARGQDLRGPLALYLQHLGQNPEDWLKKNASQGVTWDVVQQAVRQFGGQAAMGGVAQREQRDLTQVTNDIIKNADAISAALAGAARAIEKSTSALEKSTNILPHSWAGAIGELLGYGAEAGIAIPAGWRTLRWGWRQAKRLSSWHNRSQTGTLAKEAEEILNETPSRSSSGRKAIDALLDLFRNRRGGGGGGSVLDRIKGILRGGEKAAEAESEAEGGGGGSVLSKALGWAGKLFGNAPTTLSTVEEGAEATEAVAGGGGGLSSLLGLGGTALSLGSKAIPILSAAGALADVAIPLIKGNTKGALKNAAWVGGGAAVGAALGSLFFGVGAVPGAMIGAGLGSLAHHVWDSTHGLFGIPGAIFGTEAKLAHKAWDALSGLFGHHKKKEPAPADGSANPTRQQNTSVDKMSVSSLEFSGGTDLSAAFKKPLGIVMSPADVANFARIFAPIFKQQVGTGGVGGAAAISGGGGGGGGSLGGLSGLNLSAIKIGAKFDPSTHESAKQTGVSEVVEWALKNAPPGVDPKTFLTAVLAVGDLESNLDPLAVGDHGKSVGMFQINTDVPEYAAALNQLEAQGISRFDPRAGLAILGNLFQSAGGSLLKGLSPEDLAKHPEILYQLEKLVEHPNPDVAAQRYARGDFSAALGEAYTIASSVPGPQKSPPGAMPQSRSVTLNVRVHGDVDLNLPDGSTVSARLQPVDATSPDAGVNAVALPF